MPRFLLVIVLVVLLSGCESMPFTISFPAIDPETDHSAELDKESLRPLTDQLNDFISTAANGEIARIEQSPWAKNHDIMALGFYHSASGSKCRVLRLLHGRKDLPAKQYVCERGLGNWVPIRCITK